MQPEIKIALYSEVEANHFRHLQTVTAAQLDEISAAQEKAHREIQDGIESGLGKGFGIVEVGSHTTTICMAVNDKEKVHRQLLLENIELSASEIVSKPTLDDAYKALQRNECQAIYSSGLELRTLIMALKNDGTSYSISSVWNADADVQKAAKLAQEKEDADAQEKQRIQTQRESEEKLARTLDAAERATQQKQQEALQLQFGKVAAATSAKIAKVVRDFTDKPADWQKSAAYDQFPTFVRPYLELVNQQWELQSFNSEISDYGRAVWKGRSMETVFTKVEIRLRNKLLGEYRDVCFIFARMNDVEFDNIPRDTQEFRCDRTARLSSWKRDRNFQSQWLVQPQS